LSESCFNNSIFLALFDVYSYNYTKIAVKTPQFTKEIAVFLPQIWILHQTIPLMQTFILL